MSSVRIDHIETSGTFSLDGGTWDVDNNVWVIGDCDEVVIVDAAHDAPAIVRAVNGRRVVAIVAAHAHHDQINVAPALADATGAPVLLHTRGTPQARSASTAPGQNDPVTPFTDIPLTTLGGEATTFGALTAGNVALVVNVASRCGLTPSTKASRSCKRSSPATDSPSSASRATSSWDRSPEPKRRSPSSARRPTA